MERERGEDAIIDQVLGVLLREGTAQRLGALFSGLGESVGSLVTEKEELQKILAPFLFNSGRQDLHVVVRKGSSPEFLQPIQVESFDLVSNGDENSRVVLPQKQAGELELHGVFDDLKPDSKSKKRASEIRGAHSFGGMPRIHHIEHVARALIQAVTDRQAGRLNGKTVLNSLKRVFPSTHAMLEKVFHVQETDLKIEYVESREEDHAVVVCMTGAIDLKSLKEHYPSMEHIMAYAKHVDILVRDARDLFTGREEEEVVADQQGVCSFADTAGFFLRIEIENKGRDACYGRLVVCMREDSDEILSLHKDSELPVLCEDEGTYCPVAFDANQPCHFLISVDVTAKVSELGCASFSVPTLHLGFRYNGPSENSESFSLRLLHLGGQGRLTRYLLKPFLDIEAFRSLLMSSLEIRIGVLSEKDSEDHEKVGQLFVTNRIAFLRPRTVFMKCLTFFMKRQLSDINLLDLLRDLFVALGEDLTKFAATM